MSISMKRLALIMAFSVICAAAPAQQSPTSSPSPSIAPSPSPAPAGANPLERPPAAVQCNADLGYCTYVVQNARASDLLAAANLALFGGRPLIANPNGFLEVVPPGSSIRFWHTNPEMRAKMVGLIPNLDHFMEFAPRAMIQVAVSVYSISKQGLKSFDILLKSITSGTGFGTGKEIKADDDGVKVTLNMGSIQLGGFLGAQAAKGELNAVTRVEQILPNNQTLSYSNNEDVYYTLGDGVTPAKSARAGISVTSDVFLEHSNEDLVLLKSLSISFGVRDPNDQKNVINTTDGPNDVVVQANVCKVIVSANTVSRMSRRKAGLMGFSKKQVDDNARLMMVVCATPKSFADFVADNRRLAQINPANAQFDEESLRRIRKTEGGDLLAIFDSLKPFAYRTGEGEPTLGFRLDSALATASTYNRRLTVSVEGAGLKMKDKAKSVQNLMVGGLTFDAVPSARQVKPVQEINVTLRQETKQTNRPAQDDGKVLKLKLLYYSESNELVRADGKYAD